MLRSTRKFVKGALVGAAAAYVLDPDQGRARQARLRDQLLAVAGRATRWAGRRSRYTAGRVKGRVARSIGLGHGATVNDSVLDERVRTMLRNQPVATDHLTTEVVEGVVRVRGEIASEADGRMVRAALAAEPGVQHVEDLMHLPGQVPPTTIGTAASRAVAVGGGRG
jgi:osmotically-inducible protein OsmY